MLVGLFFLCVDNDNGVLVDVCDVEVGGFSRD